MAEKEKKKEGRGGVLLTKEEAKDILTDKKNWAEAGHAVLNYALEKAPLNRIPGAGTMAKVAGPPLKLAQTVAEAGWAMSTEENRANNKRNFEELAGTSVMNRLASGYLSTGSNLVGGGQLMKEWHDSTYTEMDARRSLSRALSDEAMELVSEGESASEQRKIDEERRKGFLNDVLAKRDKAEEERILREQMRAYEVREPDPREEAARIARAIREQRGLDVGG